MWVFQSKTSNSCGLTACLRTSSTEVGSSRLLKMNWMPESTISGETLHHSSAPRGASRASSVWMQGMTFSTKYSPSVIGSLGQVSPSQFGPSSLTILPA